MNCEHYVAVEASAVISFWRNGANLVCKLFVFFFIKWRAILEIEFRGGGVSFWSALSEKTTEDSGDDA